MSSNDTNKPTQGNQPGGKWPKIGLPGLGMIGLEHTYLVREGSPEPLTGTARDMIAIG